RLSFGNAKQAHGKVHTCVDGECKRAPEPRINLHEVESPIVLNSELNHRDTVPIESIHQSPGILIKIGRWCDGTPIRTCTTPSGSFVNALMSEIPSKLPTIVQEFDSEAMPRHVGLLLDRSIREVPSQKIETSLRVVDECYLSGNGSIS